MLELFHFVPVVSRAQYAVRLAGGLPTKRRVEIFMPQGFPSSRANESFVCHFANCALLSSIASP